MIPRVASLSTRTSRRKKNNGQMHHHQENGFWIFCTQFCGIFSQFFGSFCFAASTPTTTAPRSSKGQHSAPRGGPPRSWTNDELTKALENVWNRRMTTSQASRVYGIPYNSLLMYVRGKYGKSLKLDKLKETTPAAKDNLNTIGNSRSTPKEKLDKNNSHNNKSKHGSGSSCGSNKSNKLELENFMNLFPPLGPAGNNVENRVKDVMQQMQSRQALIDQSERFKELEKHMGPEQAKLLMAMPFLTGTTTVHPQREITQPLHNSDDHILSPEEDTNSLMDQDHSSPTDNDHDLVGSGNDHIDNLMMNNMNNSNSDTEENDTTEMQLQNQKENTITNNSIITSNDSNCNGTNNTNVEFSQDDNKNELKPALEVTNQGGEISAQ